MIGQAFVFSPPVGLTWQVGSRGVVGDHLGKVSLFLVRHRLAPEAWMQEQRGRGCCLRWLSQWEAEQGSGFLALLPPTPSLGSSVWGGPLGPLIGAHCFTLNFHQSLCRLQGEWDKGWRYLGRGGEEIWSRSSWGRGPGMWVKRNGKLLVGVTGNLV